MLNQKVSKSFFTFCLLVLVTLGINLIGVKAADNVKTVTVTVKAKQDLKGILDKDDFFVSEEGTKKEILAVAPATSQSAPLNLAIVVQENLSQVNNELKSLGQFIEQLPAGSQVSVTYLNGNFVKVVQPFTTDMTQAAKSLHVVSGPIGSNFTSPYTSLIDVMKQFNGMEQGRNQVLFISNGIDPLGGGITPTTNLYLQQAINIAQKENISIYTLFSTNNQFASGFSRTRQRDFGGQTSLTILADETGGYAFTGANGFVSFDAPLKEYRKLMDQQYVITYKTDDRDKGFRRIKVSTDSSHVEVFAPKGYKS